MKKLQVIALWIEAFINSLITKTVKKFKAFIVYIQKHPYFAYALTVISLSTTEEITEIVMAWMPLIFLFAMLGVVLGLLKKFGKI